MSFVAAGLSLLNISLDTLRPERFEAMTRRRGHDRVLRAVDAALALGYDPVKINVVVSTLRCAVHAVLCCTALCKSWSRWLGDVPKKVARCA